MGPTAASAPIVPARWGSHTSGYAPLRIVIWPPYTGAAAAALRLAAPIRAVAPSPRPVVRPPLRTFRRVTSRYTSSSSLAPVCMVHLLWLHHPTTRDDDGAQSHAERGSEEVDASSTLSGEPDQSRRSLR